MRKLLIPALILLTLGSASAQSATPQTIRDARVVYATGGGQRMSAMKTILTIQDKQCRISREIDTAAMLRQNPEAAAYLGAQQGRRGVSETQYIDYANQKYYSTAELPSGEIIAMEAPFTLGGEKFTISGDTTLLGYSCRVATITVNSNTIKYWFTTVTGIQGTPQPSGDIPPGLVLMASRNGNISLRAESIELAATTTSIATPLIPAFTSPVDAAMFRYRINNASVINIPVFSDEYLGMAQSNAPATIAELQPDKVYRLAGGTLLLKKVKLPESSQGWDIFAQVVQRADKDAYDRTGSIFVIPTDRAQSYLDALINGINNLPAFTDNHGTAHPGLIAAAGYNPPVELMRFFTSFGVGGYNYHKVPGQVWADSVIYRQEVTHLAPLLQGEAWIGAYIGNWVKDAHKLSLTLQYHPGGGEAGQRTVIPAFNTVNLMEQAQQEYPSFLGHDSLSVTVTVPQHIKGAQLVYLTSGHGGWGGGDEFNQKLNTLFLDGKTIFSFIPWREDCASYRDRNPASGNFGNGLSSSDLSRSNWCPGTVTNPIYIPLGDLPAGEHTLSVAIPQGPREGNSFSYWCLSGVIVGQSVDTLSTPTEPIIAPMEPENKSSNRKKNR